MSLSHEDVQEILGLLDDLDATELHVRTRHFTLSLRRDGPTGEWVQATTTPGRTAAPPPASAPPSAAPPPAAPGLIDVRTPLMGTFYRAPTPGAEPFVGVGSPVDEDTVVGIIETMKLMTSVHAGARGRVAEICLDNDRFAEQGAVLMRIAPERAGAAP